MPYDVMISYSRIDNEIAETVFRSLRSHGLTCWKAPQSLVPGTDWREEILQAIANTRVVVLLLSRHANGSKHVPREVHHARKVGCNVLPVLIEEVEPAGKLAYDLEELHWLNASSPPLESHLPKLDVSGVFHSSPRRDGRRL